MSEERTPLLKLKSRIRPDAASKPVPAVPAVGDTAPASGSVLLEPAGGNGVAIDSASPSHAKPRLSNDPVASPTLPASSAVVAPPPEGASAPALFVDAPPAPASVVDASAATHPEVDDLATARALADLQSPAATAPSLLPPPSENEEPVASPSQIPDAAAAAALFSRPQGSLLGSIAANAIPAPQPKIPAFGTFPPKPIHIRTTDQPAKAPAPTTAVRPQDRKSFKLGIGAVGVLAIMALGIGGYFGFQTFVDLRRPFSGKSSVKAVPVSQPISPAPASAASKLPAPAAKASPEQAMAPASQAGRLIQAARKVTTPNQDELNEVLHAGASPSSPRPADTSATTARPPEPPVAMKSSGIRDASPAFLGFADAIRINGVFQGNPARAHINGRTVRVGGILDAALGVVFAGIDVTTREVILQDPSGAVVRRKY